MAAALDYPEDQCALSLVSPWVAQTTTARLAPIKKNRRLEGRGLLRL